MDNMLRKCSVLVMLTLSFAKGYAQKQDSVSMKDGVHMLNEVVVNSRSAKTRIDNVQIGQEKIEMENLHKVPSLLGEHDIFKSLQLLPGIKSESDASSGFEVRGGTSSQNLVLFDNATIYQAGHLMGLFSSFNDDALTNASLFKGMIPAQYGGATSSVLDVSTKSGDMNKYHYGASIGLLSAKVYAEGPIIKDKASFLFTARRSYMDMFLKMSDDYKNSSLYFYDLNGKIDWRINANNRFSLTLFHGKDNMGISEMADMNWDNTSLTARWLHYYGSKLLSNTSAYFSDYNNYMDMQGLGMDYDQSGFIRQYGISHTLQWFPTKQLKFNIGLQSALINLRSAEWTIGDVNQREQRKAWENAVWANSTWNPFPFLSLSAGLRLNLFSALGGSPYYKLNSDYDIEETMNPSPGKIMKTYTTLEPRFSANFKLNEFQSIKLGYSCTSQNIHAIRTSASSWPFDRYTMSSNIIKPEIAHQVSLGYNRILDNGKYDFSIEGYYKDVENVYDYRDGKSYRSEIEMERLLLGGKSQSYGMELSAHKNVGNFTGWLSYTLSWVKNKIDGINNGEWYTANNDRRHDIALVVMYQLNDKWDLSASWKFNTGQALSAPSAKYVMSGDTHYYYAERNGYRAPNYHRLDIGANYNIKKAHYTSQWSFSIYNVYNQRNPFMIGFENDSSNPTGVNAYKISIFGIIPSVAYSIKF